jgi:uncharacterized caspase-like protein
MISRHIKTAGFVAVALAFAVTAALAQTNVALVIGNSAYQSGRPLSTTIADASAVAETMRGAGYDVTELRDVRQSDLGPVMRNFLDKVAAAGSNSVAFFYYAGYAAQSGGENFLVPVDAAIANASDVPNQSLPLNDLVELLAKTPAAARVVVLDASYDHGFGRGSPQAVPPGLAIMDAPAGMAIASATAPRQIAVGEAGSLSLYTHTLVTLMRQPGLDLDHIFKAARHQVNQATGGKQTPWMASGLLIDVTLFSAPVAAPPAQAAVPPPAAEPSGKKEPRRRAERPRRERPVRESAEPAEAAQAPAVPPIIGIIPGAIGIGRGGFSIGIGQ